AFAIVVAEQLRVAAEVEEVGKVARALEPAEAGGEQPRAAEPQVKPPSDVEGLPRQRAGDLRRHVVGEPHGTAGEGPELPEDRRLLHERRAERDERAVAEDGLAVRRLLVL